MPHDTMHPIHPGEVLAEVYLKPSEPPMTVESAAAGIDVSPDEVRALIEGRRDITITLALRLADLCRTTTEYWVGLQETYDRQLADARVSQLHRQAERGITRSDAA